MPSIDRIVTIYGGVEGILVFMDEDDENPTLVLDDYGTMKGYSDVIIQPSKNTKWSDYTTNFELGDIVVFKNDIYIIEDIQTDGNGKILEFGLFNPVNKVRERVNQSTCIIKATPDVRDCLNIKLHSLNKHYSTSKRLLVDWFNTYDKVLVKSNDDVWFATIFSCYNKDKEKFVDISGREWDFCKLYEK